MPDVYLLHFKRPYWGKCRHYLGYAFYGTEDRVKKHRSGNGSLLVKYALNRGNDFEVVLVETFKKYQDARRRERKLKKAGHYPDIFPKCKGGSK